MTQYAKLKNGTLLRNEPMGWLVLEAPAQPAAIGQYVYGIDATHPAVVKIFEGA